MITQALNQFHDAQAPLPRSATILADLLASGGDERITLDSVTGRNRYGTSTRPAPGEIWLSSSTASAPTMEGFAAAAAALERSMVEGDDWLFDDIRGRLLALYGISGSACILTPSGTDAELLVLGLAQLRTNRPILNLVVGPSETGSGVPLAAGGARYLSTTPFGAGGAVGDQHAGLVHSAVRCIAVRESDGTPRTDEAIRAEAAGIIDEALAAGAHVILHSVDATKTGRVALSHATALELTARAPDRIDCVIDACQLRASPETIRAYLASGCMVMISGSKFASGPAFCGALLLPSRFASLTGSLPPSLGDVSSVHDWPVELRSSASSLRVRRNLGLGLRWSAALAEIEAYTHLPVGRLSQARRVFETIVKSHIDARPALSLLDPESLQAERTIFPIIMDGDAGTPDGAKRIHQLLMAPVDGMFPRCHLGQPVMIGERAALRVCASMPLLRDVAVRLGGSTDGEAGFTILNGTIGTAFAALDVAIATFRSGAR